MPNHVKTLVKTENKEIIKTLTSLNNIIPMPVALTHQDEIPLAEITPRKSFWFLTSSLVIGDSTTAKLFSFAWFVLDKITLFLGRDYFSI